MNCNNILQYYYLHCILLINADLVSIKYIFQKFIKILTEPKVVYNSLSLILI